MKINFINRANYSYSNPQVTFKAIYATKQEMRDYVANHPDEGLRGAAQHFETSIAYVQALLGIEPPIKKLKSLPVTKENIISYLTKHPKTNIDEMAEYFHVSTVYLGSFLRKFNINLDDVDSFLSAQETKRPYYIPCSTDSYKPAAAKPKPPTEEELKDYIMTHPDENLEEISENFNVSTPYIRKLITLYDIHYESKAQQKLPKIPEKELRDYISAHPDETQSKIGEHFQTSGSKISQLIRDYDIPYADKKFHSMISKEVLEEYIKTHPNENHEQIANHFGVTKAQVGILIKKFDIPYLKKKAQLLFTEEELRSYVLAHPEATLSDIGDNFNATAAYIGHAIKVYGIPYQIKTNSSHVTISKEELAEYIKANPDKSLRRIGEHFGTSDVAISALVKKYEIPYVSKKTIGKRNEN